MATVGAAICARRPMACGPRIAIATLISQKIPNANQRCSGKSPHIVLSPRQEGNTVDRIASSAPPPNHELMPNHPAAISARAKAGTCAPRVPNQSRAKTGYGMPYLVPACETSKMALSTTTLPTKMASTDSHQFKPSEIMLPASVYVGMHKHIPIHNEANFEPGQVCSASVHGRRSSFHIEWFCAARS